MRGDGRLLHVDREPRAVKSARSCVAVLWEIERIGPPLWFGACGSDDNGPLPKEWLSRICEGVERKKERANKA